MATSIDLLLAGPSFDAEHTAPGFVIDQHGVLSFFVNREDTRIMGGRCDECYVSRNGGAWHRNDASKPQDPARSRLNTMAFRAYDRGENICVFLDGKPVGEGQRVRVSLDWGQEDELALYVDGWTVALFRDGHWRRRDRRGDLHETGVLTIGPLGFHDAVALDPPEPHFAPLPRSRPSDLSSARLAFSA